MKTFKIMIDQKGNITIEAQNFQGSSCLEATKALTEKLGSVLHSCIKPEYYQVDEQKEVW